MPLGLARDSMLDLAELAKKVDDGEYKTSIEITDIDDTPPENNMLQISHKKQSGLGNGFLAPPNTTPSTIDGSARVGGDSKAARDYEDLAMHDDDDRSSIANSSIDSDMALQGNSAAVPSTTPPSMMNGSSPSKSKSYGRYSGFDAVNYDDYYQHDYTAYSGNGQAVPNLLGKKESQPLWCCFLPWGQAESPKPIAESSEREEDEETLVNVQTTPPSSSIARSSSKEEDETSIGSDALGERLSEKDRQAVLARLRLAQPEDVTSSDSDANNTPTPSDPNHVSEKGLLNGIAIPPSNDNGDDHTSDSIDKGGSAGIAKGDITSAGTTTKQPVGILLIHSRTSKNSLEATSQQISGDAQKRRSLFPSYSETKAIKKDVSVSFSPMARVLSVKSNKDMDDAEKGAIWWQKEDYEEFRKTGRMIAKAMLEGGSEIWLATNQSWQVPNQARSTTLRNATSLSKRQTLKKNGTSSSKTQYENTRDKWWHKFGHSRRGLEHIASIDEGRQRQGNVRRAIRAVVEENKRQRAFFREDADKLRMVSLQRTTWARDLSTAAGASDADAVHTNFNDESRKSREFYLLKFSKARQQQQTKDARIIPDFMRPGSSLQVQPNRLDANTIPQIRYRQSTHKKKLASFTSGRRLSGAKVSPLKVSPRKEQQHQRQGTGQQQGTSMAKKAAGFASGEAVANMSAVLTGMGPLPKSATMVT